MKKFLVITVFFCMSLYNAQASALGSCIYYLKGQHWFWSTDAERTQVYGPHAFTDMSSCLKLNRAQCMGENYQTLFANFLNGFPALKKTNFYIHAQCYPTGGEMPRRVSDVPFYELELEPFLDKFSNILDGYTSPDTSPSLNDVRIRDFMPQGVTFFMDMMIHIKNNWFDLNEDLKISIVGVLLVTFSIGAILLFFSGGAALAFEGLAVGVIASVLFNLLVAQGHIIPGYENLEPQASVEIIEETDSTRTLKIELKDMEVLEIKIDLVKARQVVQSIDKIMKSNQTEFK